MEKGKENFYLQRLVVRTFLVDVYTVIEYIFIRNSFHFLYDNENLYLIATFLKERAVAYILYLGVKSCG